jgi:hypothetical protein
VETAPTCHLYEQREGPFEHAAYVLALGATRHYVGWLCRDCAFQHGSHNRFAAAMVKRGDVVWLVSHPGTPYEHSYTVLPRR